MSYNFDQIVTRRGTDSIKWSYFGAEALPMWVADMDFASPQPIVDALQERVAQGVFGYGAESDRFREILVARMGRLYRWSILPEDIVFLPGLVTGLNVMARAIDAPGSGALVNTPVYGPFLTAPDNQGHSLQVAPLAQLTRGQRIHYTVNMAAFEEALRPETRLFILCNPHNPVGRAYGETELLAMAEFAARHHLVICSDEIHCDLLLGGAQHIPMASLAPEIGQQTITLMAPSKTFNIPGLGASFAIVQNPTLRKQFVAAAAGIVPHPNILGMVAMEAAFADCDDWLQALRAYLTANRDYAVHFVEQNLPRLRVTNPEATYLLWLDCRDAGIEGVPGDFFLKQAQVAVSDGKWFGKGGEGFVRLNFGCPRALLEEGLVKIKAALDAQATAVPA